MPIINTFIEHDMSNNQEWDVVNIASNLQKMIDSMVEHYFKSFITNFDYKISWDVNNVISDDSSFKIFHSDKEILISTVLQVHPRTEIVSILFHILIHFYLNKISKDGVKITQHDENFRGIMIFLNETLNIKITVRVLFNFILHLPLLNPSTDITQNQKISRRFQLSKSVVSMFRNLQQL
jgi:hypothetical protein